MRHGDVLDVDGTDPLAAGLDHVLAAVGDLHETVGVDGRDIARVEPTVCQQRFGIVLEIVRDDPRAPHQQVAGTGSVPWQFAPLRIDDLHVDAEYRPALLREDGKLIRLGQGRVSRLQFAHGAERRHLGHAPAVQHLDVELAESVDHRRWTS